MKLIKPDTYKTKYNYYATERGEIFSEISNRFLIPFVDKDGYQRVGLTVEGGRRSAPVHRLVMMAFYPREDSSSLQVNHIDSNRMNNNLENLEWVTARENVIHSMDFGARKNRGEENFFSNHSERDILEIIDLIYFTNMTFLEISNCYNCSVGAIEQISGNRTWKHLPRPSSGKLYRRQNREAVILDIIEKLKEKKMNCREIAKHCGVSVKVVYDIKNKKTWKKLTEDIIF